MKFVDVVNPTAEELRRWAADPGADYPEEMSQDWDLMVARWPLVDVIVELASDQACPQRAFFLRVLYLMAGDCVRTPAGRANEPHLRALLVRLESTGSEALRVFRRRAVALMGDPSRFEYGLWCDGGYLGVEGDSAGGG